MMWYYLNVQFQGQNVKVAPQDGTCFMFPSWRIQFWGNRKPVIGIQVVVIYMQATCGSGIWCVYITRTKHWISHLLRHTGNWIVHSLTGDSVFRIQLCRVLDCSRQMYRTPSNFRETDTSERRYLHSCCSTFALLNVSLKKATNPSHQTFLELHVFAF